MARSVLIVDDNQKLSHSLSRNFSLKNITSRTAATVSHAINLINTEPFDLILLDIILGEESGLDILKRISQEALNIPVIIITGHATLENAINALKNGAADYIQKPIRFQNLYEICEPFFMNVPSKTNESLEQEYITENPQMKEILVHIQKLGPTDMPILITGESGTGKEVLADYIHAVSKRSDYAMVKLNCASIPESLLENELFGHEKGAYTGAHESYSGIFEKSNGSTLFLDEIGDMSLSIQSKILRAVQNQEVRRIGGNHVIHTDVRFIAATNQCLDKLMETNHFREDLYYRLSSGHIHLPPLRERKEDLPILIRHFLDIFSTQLHKTLLPVEQDLYDLFLAYDWPGNIRELKNVLQYSFTVAEGTTIRIQDLPAAFNHRSAKPEMRNFSTIDNLEKELIRKTLSATRYNKKQTAIQLNISRTTLYQKIRKYGLG